MTERETKRLEQALFELRAYYSLRYDNFWTHYEEVNRNHRYILNGHKTAN